MTSTERARAIEALFDAALDVPPADRRAFLDARCGDEALRREVEQLLAADDTPDADAFTPPSGDELSAALSAEDRLVGTSLGAWQLESVLGTGGMGRVYLASRRTDFEQRAAVKLIRSDLDGEQVLARFHHERATQARLEHPGIARLLDGGTTPDGRPWLATEHIEGRQLDAWARDATRAERLHAFLAICDAVAYAHDHLVVHRDIKPANVLVERDGTPRLLDFGVAKVLGDDTDRRARGDTSGSPLVTRDGASPLTPAYASPEQLAGEPATPASDVYALGVVLAELLTGRRPEGPDDVDAAQLDGDHAAILRKALVADPRARYPRAETLADDLRRAAGRRPVLARGDGWAYRARCLVRRHRVASALAAALVVFAVLAGAQQVRAWQRDEAHLADILRLSDGYTLRDLRDAMDGPLWPARDNAEQLDAWLTEADAVLSRRARHQARLAELSSRVAAGEADDETLWWYEQLTELVAALDALDGDDVHGHTVAAVEHRRRMHDEIVDASLGGSSADAWRRAIASIADRARCPAYDGLEISPQWSLRPLHRDPRSGLWEFVDVQTGAAPEVAPEVASDGTLAVDAASAVVFVLVPGGVSTIGSSPSDPLARPDEVPAHEVRLEPFFVSKYELTQGQWVRATGARPSRFDAYSEWDVDDRHPVEQVSWDLADETLRRLGWSLPTEAQWEYAARAGTSTPWSCGASAATLDGVANLADLDARDGGGSSGWSYDEAAALGLRDGHVVHAPVGGYAPNAFGLHDVHGNVWEWCRDMPMPYHPDIAIGAGGLRVIPDDIGDLGTRVLRGGAFSNPPERARSAARWSARRDFATQVVGLRPVRVVEP